MKKQIVVNKAYLPYIDAQETTQIFYGGSSSGKSFFLAQRCIIDVLKGRNYLVIRNVAATIRNSVYNQICKTISDMGVKHLFKFTGSNMTIRCLTNGKEILFAGLDDVEKLKSITPSNGMLTDIWVEEATETKYEAYKQLTKRLRGVDMTATQNLSKRVTMSFNPVMKTHWIYKEFFGGWDDTKDIYKDDYLLIRKTTYKDNSFLTDEDKRNLENETDPYFYDVYTLGNWGVLGDLVFRNWHVEDLSDMIPSFANIYNGLDFGFSTDPNAFIRVNVDQAQRKIYVFDEYYKAGMLNDELAEVIKARIQPHEYVACDNGGALNIADLCRNGIHAYGVKKGANSLNFGIQWLQGYEIIIDTKCQNFKNEIQAYQWEKDKYGNSLRRPVDRDNHLMDALRYATETLQIGAYAGATKRV